MAGKAKRKRRKHHPQTKKGKIRQRLSAAGTQQPAAMETSESVSPQAVAAPPSGVPAPVARPKLPHYPYIATELRTIGVLAGAILIILIVLSLVLS